MGKKLANLKKTLHYVLEIPIGCPYAKFDNIWINRAWLLFFCMILNKRPLKLKKSTFWSSFRVIRPIAASKNRQKFCFFDFPIRTFYYYEYTKYWPFKSIFCNFRSIFVFIDHPIMANFPHYFVLEKPIFRYTWLRILLYISAQTYRRDMFYSSLESYNHKLEHIKSLKID